MLEINGKLIDTPIIDILYDLRKDLYSQSIYKLKDIEVKSNNIVITCPFHKDGNETHPSSYIYIGENNDKLPVGTFNCFTCHHSCNFQTFISNCFNIDDNGEYGKHWLLERYPLVQRQLIRNIKKIDTIRQIKQEEKINIVNEKELQSYRFYHPYMFQRKLTKEVINKFDIGYDKKTNCVTFPVYDEQNRCLFVVKRNVDFKKFYIPEGVDKAIFGINHIDNNCNQVIICESVFNTLTAEVYGFHSLALFGTGSESQYKTLNKLPIRRYILMFDGDNAGRKGAERFKQNIKDKIITDIHLPQGKDVNDLSKEEFLNLLKINNVYSSEITV